MLFAVFVSLGVCHGEADVCVVLFVEKKVDDWHIFMQWLDLDLELSSAFDGSCELGKRSVVARLLYRERGGWREQANFETSWDRNAVPATVSQFDQDLFAASMRMTVVNGAAEPGLRYRTSREAIPSLLEVKKD